MSQTACQITFMGTPLHLAGKTPGVGEKAPGFTLMNAQLQPVKLEDTSGVRIFTTFPSIDTPVCDSQMKTFQDEVSKLGDVGLYGISADLPFAQKRWSEENDSDAITFLSDFDSMSFGDNWGVRVVEIRLLARAVFVLDADDVIHHLEVVGELTNQPNYSKAVEAVRKLI